MAYSGGWGSVGAWNAPKQQMHDAAALDGEDKLPIKAATNQLSEVDLSSGTAQPGHSSLLSSIRAYNSSTAAAPSDLSSREAALAQREAAVKAKERELAALEAEMKKSGFKRRNWPVCMPLIHHDINGDIPQHMRAVVRMAYHCYLGLVLCLVYNLAGACTMVALKAPDRMSSWFLAVIYCLAGVPLALWLWYLKLYNAAASDGSLSYLGFFFSFAIHTAFCTWAAIAVPIGGERWSFTGFVSALRAFDVGKAGGIIFLIGACLWTLEALASLWVLKMVYSSFRSGGKQQQAKNELTKMAVKAAMDNKV